jgi:HK97 family phage major capsid protein
MKLYELKMALQMVGEQLKATEQDISAKAADPTAPIVDVQNLRTKKGELQERFNVLKEQHDQLEADQQAALNANKGKFTASTDPKDQIIAAKAEFIRAAIQNRQPSQDAVNILQTQNALRTNGTGTTGGGDKFLPTTMSTQIISEPLVKNPLREIIGTSNIKGLELPKISFTIDDDDFITDDQTAKELKLTGDKVTFGRNKFKVFAAISDTVMYGSDLELVTYVENALRSGLAAKEKKVSFTKAPKTGEEHMSFYSTANGITVVNGTTRLKAIKAAIAALPEDYRENAKVVMTYSDYVDILEDLSNGSTTLYDAPPERIIGKPTEFSDAAVDPIVGDFSYAHLNYDGELVYDTDKDVKTGDFLFVLTAWFDQQLKLKAAFRIAKVVPEA